ncbi:MAG: hypothetical protein P8R42_22560 [Candidatus Binatia bacterium]|nr:hypothetical protein [Candidatus Binatia bacterium]
MSTVLDALRKAQDGDAPDGAGSFGDGPPRPPRKGGPRFLWIALGLIALVGAFAGGLELSGGGSSTRTEETVEAEAVAEPLEVAAVVEPEPAPPARVEPTRPPPQERVPVARPERVSREVKAAPPLDNAPAAVKHKPMSEKRRRVLERVMARREDRAGRRENRFAKREESQGLREAIRSAGTPEEREELLTEFRQTRNIARMERKAASAERRLVREEERMAQGAHAVTGTYDPTAPRPQREIPPAPGVRPAPAPAPAIVRAPPPAPAPVSGEPLVLSASGPTDEGLRRPPSSAPQVRINILQYSSNPGRRFAYMSVEGNPAMTQVREGESYQGLTVKRILPEQVEFAHQGATFLLRAN